MLLSISTRRNSILPLSLNLSYNFWMEGISALQGGHHVAQKSIKTTLPLRSLTWTGFPLSSTKDTAGPPVTDIVCCSFSGSCCAEVSNLGLNKPSFISWRCTKPLVSGIRTTTNSTPQMKYDHIFFLDPLVFITIMYQIFPIASVR